MARAAAAAAALALVCLLASPGAAQAQGAPPGFTCADLPSTWGNDQDNNNENNDNTAWSPLEAAPSEASQGEGLSMLP